MGHDPDGADPKYSVTWKDLEAAVHVPFEDQVAEQPTPAAPATSSEWESERHALRLAGGA